MPVHRWVKVDDRAAHRERSRILDHRCSCIPRRREHAEGLVPVDGCPFDQTVTALFEGRSREHPPAQGRRRQHQHPRGEPSGQSEQHPHPPQRGPPVRLDLGVGRALRRWQYQYPGRGQRVVAGRRRRQEESDVRRAALGQVFVRHHIHQGRQGGLDGGLLRNAPRHVCRHRRAQSAGGPIDFDHPRSGAIRRRQILLDSAQGLRQSARANRASARVLPGTHELKQAGIYRKLLAMALTLPWLQAAVVSSLAAAVGGVAPTPSSPLVQTVVSRVVNDTAARMAGRRGVRLTRPLVVRLVDPAQLAEARAALAQDAEHDASGTSPEHPPPRADATGTASPAERHRLLHQTLYGHLGWTFPVVPGAPELPDRLTGLYDQFHERLLVASWADLSTDRLPWVRDIAQALLDRRFDLGRWLSVPFVPGAAEGADHPFSSDALLARRAIPYGDATVQALEELDPEGNLPSPRALAAHRGDIDAQGTGRPMGPPTAERRCRCGKGCSSNCRD